VSPNSPAPFLVYSWQLKAFVSRQATGDNPVVAASLATFSRGAQRPAAKRAWAPSTELVNHCERVVLPFFMTYMYLEELNLKVGTNSSKHRHYYRTRLADIAAPNLKARADWIPLREHLRICFIFQTSPRIASGRANKKRVAWAPKSACI